MAKNSTKTPAEIARKFQWDLFSTVQNDAIMIRLENFYGEWGLYIASNVAPYVWIVPLLITILLLIVFRRTRLNGPTQKCLACILVVDVLYTTFSGVRDGVFKLMDANYGFLEYRLCRFFMIGYRILSILHATSLWIKCFMLIHQICLFLIPFRVRLINFKRILIPLGIFHVVICSLYCYEVTLLPVKGIPTIQDFVPGRPLKKIIACSYDEENEIYQSIYYPVLAQLTLIVQFYYSSAIPIFINFLCTIGMIILVKKEIRLVSRMQQNKNSSQTKYIILMKVTSVLGISFLIQEIPVMIGLFYVLRLQYNSVSEKLFEETEKAHGEALFQVCLSFWLGKPIDCVVYASLSKVVRKDLMRLFKIDRVIKSIYRKTERSVQTTHTHSTHKLQENVKK